jgi:aryl-alcohol dehydrogenase-like predicted oxidoreductase
MIRSLEGSLRRLQTDYVDVFMPHFPDGLTPMDEILSALDDLIRSGKVRYGGLSNFPAWRVAGAAVQSDLRGLAPVVAVEAEYSLAERSADRELIPMAHAHGMGVLMYSPLAGGLLTGKYRRGETGRLAARGEAIEDTAQRTAVVDEVLAIADDIGAPAAEVALAWLRRHAAQTDTTLIPIVGPRSMTHLQSYVQSLDLELSNDHYTRLASVSAVRLGTPHEDVLSALDAGYDGDRSTLHAASSTAVI